VKRLLGRTRLSWSPERIRQLRDRCRCGRERARAPGTGHIRRQAAFTRQGEVTSSPDDVRIGQPHDAVDPDRIRAIAAEINAAGIPTSYAANVAAILWNKILYNAALNPLGAVLECTYGQLAENPGTRQVMDRIIDEIFQVAQAHGMPLNWKTPEEYRQHFYTRLVLPRQSIFLPCIMTSRRANGSRSTP